MNQLIGVVLLTAAVAGGAQAGQGRLEVASEEGLPVAQFAIGDSQCELRDDQIHCTRAQR